MKLKQERAATGILVILASVFMGFIMIASIGDTNESDGSSNNKISGYSNAAGDDILLAYLKGWELASWVVTDDGEQYICYTDYEEDIGDRNYGPGVCHRLPGGTYQHIEEYNAKGIDIASGEYDDVDVDKLDIEIVDYVFMSIVENRYMKTVLNSTEGYTLTKNQLHALTAVAYQYGNVDGAAEFLASGGTDRDAFWVTGGYKPFALGGGKCSDDRVEANWQLFSEGIYTIRSGEVLNPANFGSKEKEESVNKSFTTFDNFLFLGDSYTVGLESYVASDEKFKNAEFCGETGKTPQYWIDNFTTLPSTANGVCVLLGINDPSQTTQMKTLIDKLVEQYGSSIPIYIQKVFHAGKTRTGVDELNKNIDSYNNEIKKYISEIGHKNVSFIDTTSGCIDETGYLKDTDDGLHLNNEGYSKWVSNLKKAILKSE